MRTKKLSAILFALVAALSLMCISAFADAYEVGDGYIRFDFSSICAGLSSGKADAIIEKNVSFEGKTAMKFTPAPDNAQGASFALDSYSIHQFAKNGVTVTLPDYKFVGVTYYYETNDPTYRNKPLSISILPGATKATTGYVSANSNNNIVTNQWATAYFNLSDAMTGKVNPDTDTPYVSQVHFRPFGTIKPQELLETDIIYVADMTFYKENPDKDAKVDVAFNKGNPGAKGEDKSYLYSFGEEYTLPENPYDFGESAFLGWLCSYDGKLYQPGEKFKAERSVYYTASWNVVREYADSITLSYADYQNGPVNSKPTAKVEQVEKDGRTAVKIVATPEGNPENTRLALDGYNYKKAGIDLGVYRWATMEYYYESDAPVKGDRLFLSMLRSGDVFIEGQHYANVYASEDIVADAWAVAVFDFSILDERINKANTDLNLRQMHFRPWGKTFVNNLVNNDVMYIGNLTFYKNKPDIATHTSYMNGYEDGTFKPSGTMTRAEACTVVARLLEKEENIIGTSAFADVKGHWAEKYIGFCESKGLLSSYSGNFEPGKAITRAEFSELVYLTGLAQDKGIAAAFSDVTEAHPKYTSIMAAAKAGLINGYDEGNGTFTFKPDNTVTRAEVVTIVNRARSTSKTPEKLTPDISVLFLDVDDTHWAFANIAEATVPHVEMGGKWHSVMKDPASALAEKLSEEQIAQLYKLDEGKAKIEELDALEAKRIEEIRNTPSMDLSKIKGKLIYVSSSVGDDSNDGLSENTPVKTLSKASSLARTDDAVLLKRGDLFRERITAKAGVTYSAYGDGAKPVLYGSPENGADASKWSLIHEDTGTGALIWQYNNGTMQDVGAIVFNDGEGYAIKDVPYYLNGKFYVKGNTAVEYDYKTGLDHNFKFFHAAGTDTGVLYLRCDNGNPGKVFDSIEFVIRGSQIAVSANSDVTIDNLCIKYAYYGITAATQKNLTVTNCEIGWIGGSAGSYNEKSGVPTRAGNAVEVYGGCDGYIVDNCYIYQCYDAGVTHQVSASTKGNLRQDDVKYTNNVITDCVYSVEYFFGADASRVTEIRAGENFLIENNLLRRAGFGFGSSRPDINNQRHIRSGSAENEFTNFEIKNNVFDRAVQELFQIQSFYDTTLPSYSGNTYIQGIGNRLYLHGNESANTNPAAQKVINKVLGDKDAKVYYVPYIPAWSFSYSTDRKAEITEEDRKVVEPTKPSAEESSAAATDSIQALPTESSDIKAPSYEKIQSKAKIFNEAKASVNAEEMKDELLGMKYMHFTFNNTDDRVMLNCYGFTGASCEDDVVYFKVLMRTNLKVKPGGMIYQLIDENGNAMSGNKSVTALNETTGSGDWETVIMRASGFPDGAKEFKQLQFFIAGTGVNGTKFHDGTYPTDSYIDIAGWAVLPNLASANAYSVMEKALG